MILFPCSELYFSRDGFHFLGPFSDVWKSACFVEFGYDLIHDITDAGANGLLTINKFWAFERYNYLVFSTVPSSRQVNRDLASKNTHD